MSTNTRQGTETVNYLQTFYQQITGCTDINDASVEDYCQIIKDYYDNLLATTPGHVYWLNRNNVYLGCNDRQAESLGLKSRKEIIGKTNYDLPWKNEADALNELNNKVMTTGIGYLEEEVAAVVDRGEIRRGVFLSNKIPLRDKSGKVIGVIGVSIDITDKKRAEELEKEKFALIKIGEALHLLAGCIAHEIGTALSVIAVNVDGLQLMLRDPNADFNSSEGRKELVKRLKNIRAGVDRNKNIMSMLLAKMRTLSNPAIGKEHMQKESITRTIREAFEEYPFVGNEREIIHLETPDVDFYYLGELTLVKHVLFNLLKNSLRAVLEKDNSEIYISLHEGKDENRLIFKDTACGIPADQIDKIFLPFTSFRSDGSGLGLAFCKFVIESFGGSISCNSEPGVYTEFTVTFPRVVES